MVTPEYFILIYELEWQIILPLLGLEVEGLSNRLLFRLLVEDTRYLKRILYRLKSYTWYFYRITS